MSARELPVVVAETSHMLPESHSRWLSGAGIPSVPVEHAASCDSCPMCASADQGSNREFSGFLRETKCCTYSPRLPNYTVGELLLDDSLPPKVKEEVRRKIGSFTESSPMGINPLPSRLDAYEAVAERLFGRSEALLCEYYSDGGCGIWRYRNAVCATWFCKHTRGEISKNFWRDVRSFLLSVEESVSFSIALRLGIPDTAIREHLAQSNPAEARAMELAPEIGRQSIEERWGSWVDDRVGYYLACARLKREMSVEDAFQAGGARLHARMDLLTRSRMKLLSAEIPSRLRPNPVTIQNRGPDFIRLSTYSPYDPIEAPRALLDILPYFDGSPLESVKERLEAQLGVSLEHDFVRRLLDFGVLVAA